MEDIGCNWCLKSFVSKGNLNRHIHSVHLNENWDSGMCKKSFGEKQNLLRHKRNIHQNQITKRYKQEFLYDTQKRRKSAYNDTSKPSNSEETEHCESNSTCSENNEEDDSENTDYNNEEE